MKVSILIPHYKTPKMTAYCLHQIFKHSQRHEIEVVVIDNGQGEGIEGLGMFPIKLITYPSGVMQSHGIAFDYALRNGHVSNEYFITLETDSFPVSDGWLDYYENLINQNFDSAGSFLQLSGGYFMHPTGAMYRQRTFQEADKYVQNLIMYSYYPNIAMRDNHPTHLMVRRDFKPDFLKDPEKFIQIRTQDLGYDFNAKEIEYMPVAKSVFHQGMGNEQERFTTYGLRIKGSVYLNNEDRMIYRMAYEPGQWLSYFMDHQKKVYPIPTQTVWMPGRINQQQEYTLSESGIKHLWAVTAYMGVVQEDLQDIVKFKENIVNELYESIKG